MPQQNIITDFIGNINLTLGNLTLLDLSGLLNNVH